MKGDILYSDNEFPLITQNRTVFPPGHTKSYALVREISEYDLNQIEMNLMPGFRVEWHYNKDLGLPEQVDDVLPWKCNICAELKRLISRSIIFVNVL